MTEEEAKDVNNQESVAPEAQQTEQVPAAQESQEATKESTKEYNFARLREKNEQLERKLMDMETAIRKQSAPQVQEEEDDIDAIADDDIVTKSQVKRMATKMAKEIVNQTLAEKERQSIPDRMRSRFNDFDQVLTEENIREFEKNEPALAAACASASNPWEASYYAIKKLILPEQKKTRASEKENERIEANMNKPLSVNTAAKSPLASANAYANGDRHALYLEMMEAAKRG